MLDRISPEQFDEWMAEYTIQPWGIEYTIPEEPEQKPNGLAAMRQMIGV